MKIIKALGIASLLLVLVGVGLGVTGYGGQLFFMAFTALNKPAGDFKPTHAVAAPDYNLPNYWAALPGAQDPADLAPAGVEVQAQGTYPVDVFFIHPTGFLTSASWTSPMDENSGTGENTRFMMANQASAFNGCCNVYAPRYRQANIFAYFASTPAERDEVLGFAYQDVKRAFVHYLEHDNHDRPFIIAGHSQGSHHAKRLLQEVIDTSDLHQRLVAAYLIGSILIPLSPSWFDSMQHISPCETADDLHCVVGWDSVPEGGPALQRPQQSLCTNPLSWTVSQDRADANLNQGALAAAGALNQAIGRVPDVPSGQLFETLGAPIPGKTWAQCRDGSLFVEAEQGVGFELDAMGTFHQSDYALFYMNIHNNAKLRARRFEANSLSR